MTRRISLHLVGPFECFGSDLQFVTFYHVSNETKHGKDNIRIVLWPLCSTEPSVRLRIAYFHSPQHYSASGAMYVGSLSS